MCETWLADSNPSDMSRKVSNPLATAGKYTHQQWNPAYLAAKVAIYPTGADEGDLDTYLATEAASNPTEEDSDNGDDEGSEQPAAVALRSLAASLAARAGSNGKNCELHHPLAPPLIVTKRPSLLRSCDGAHGVV